MLRVESAFFPCRFLKLFWNEMVEFRVQHPDDLAGFIVDDGLGLFVEQAGHSVSSRVLGIRLKI